MHTGTTLEMTTATVADIALKMPQAIDLLNRYHLDYCCNGKRKFLAACYDAELDAEKIWREIQQQKGLPAADTRMKFSNWETGLLIDFIVQHHHAYVRQAIPHLQELLTKVCSVHGTETPDLLKVKSTFEEIANELLDHMPKEEVVLFPAIRRITYKESETAITALFNIQAPIHAMEHEHEEVGNLIKDIRHLTDQYTPPAHACPTFQLTYKLLWEFDNDLMQHVHLENNVLFPMVKPAAQII